MGQGPSHELETRVENPPDGRAPRGLALIAHGRLGGSFDQPPVRLLAEYLCNKRQLRVVTWNDRGVGRSPGPNEWNDLATWVGDTGTKDYNGMLNEHMRKFTEEFRDFGSDWKAQLFICGYSAGAIYAGCARPLPCFYQFAPAHYILISYPVELNPVIGIFRSGSYFRSIEALVQGHGWENLPSCFGGKEPEVSGVLTITGQHDTSVFYGMWTGILQSKNSRNALDQAIVADAGHDWNNKAHCIVEEVEKWLSGR